MKLTEEQKADHEVVMLAVCHHFQRNGLPMVLKRGTALRLCYGLDRFSEDLDFDSAKGLNLEHPINDAFISLGKAKPQFRKPEITITKKTDSVHRYTVDYGSDLRLKIETSLRGTPRDEDLAVVNDILTYKIPILIEQKLSALQGRTTARDLHDIIFLYENYYDDFGNDSRAAIVELYNGQSEAITRFDSAYEEDPVLDTTDLLTDLINLVELVESHDES